MQDDKPSKTKPTFGLNLLPYLCFGLVTLIYCFPLVSNLTTAIPGTTKDHDVATMVWNVGWVQYALNHGADLLRTEAVLVPLGADLRMHTYGLLQGLLAYPLAGWVGVVGAYNLILMFTFFLNGVFIYHLIRREVQHTLAAMVAAVWTMLATPFLFHFTVGRPAFASIWIVCGALLTAGSLFDRPRLWKGAVLGLWLVAALFSDFQIVLFSGLWLLLYGGYRLWRGFSHNWKQGLSPAPHLQSLIPIAISLAVAGLIFAVPFGLVFYPALAQAGGDGYPQPGLDGMRPYSFLLWQYFTPDTMLYAYGFEIFVCVLAAFFILRRGQYLFWFGSGVFFLVLALGPFLHPTDIPLPMALLSNWSPLGQFRTPGRLTMPALIGLGVVTGYVLGWALPRLRPRGVLWGFVGLAIAGRLGIAVLHDPLAVQFYPDYAIYHQIATEPGDFSLLEVPVGVRTGLERIGQGGEVLEYYQSTHHKPLINGMIARVPSATFRFYRQYPSLLFLAGENVQGDLKEDFAKVLGWSKAGYVLVHGNLLSVAQLNQYEAFLDSQPQLTRLGAQGDLIIYWVKPLSP